MSYRDLNETIFNTDSKVNGSVNNIIDPNRVLDALTQLSDTLKNLDGVMSSIEVSTLPDYTPEFLPARNSNKLPNLIDFSSTPASNAVIVFDELEFGPADANTVYQNDYTFEVTIGDQEIFSVPFTAEALNVDAVQQLELSVQTNNGTGVWWLSTQPGGTTLAFNSFIYDRGLGGSIFNENQIYQVRSYDSTTDTGNSELYTTQGELVPTGQYWLNFATARSTGVFDTSGRLIPNINICPGTPTTNEAGLREMVILIQGNTISYDEV